MRAHRNALLALPALALAASSFLTHALPAGAASSGAALTPGEVLALQGTDHLWVVDDQGVAHLAADATALAGKQVDFATRQDETLAELEATPRGAPWLSADFVRIEGEVYLPTFPVPGGPPLMLHVQSAGDLALLGVTADNMDQLVLDPDAWQQRYGMDPTKLEANEFRLYPAPADVDDQGSYGASRRPAPGLTAP
jgi:hypothetical protein